MNKTLQVLIFTIAFLLTPNLVLAQYGEDTATGVLEAILGKIPSACIGGNLGNPECIQCLTVVNIVPFAFFLSIFFLVFYLVIQMMVPGKVTGHTQRDQPVYGPGEMTGAPLKIAAIISFVLTLLIVHTELGRVTQLGFWITLFFIILALLLMKSLFKVTGAMLPIMIIIVVIVIAMLFSFISGGITPLLQQWQDLCIG